MTDNDRGKTSEGGEEDKSRRLLGGLKRITAPPDFEHRLRKRLAEKQGRFFGAFGRTPALVPLRIPVYAASVVAILGAAVLAYYALLRTGVSPSEFTSPQQKVEAPFFGDSLKIQEERDATEREDQPATIENRSSRIHPRGEKAPTIALPKESNRVVPSDEFRALGGRQLDAAAKSAEPQSGVILNKEADTAGTKKDTLKSEDEAEKKPSENQQ